MAIRSLRSQVRADNLKNQARPAQSLTRKLFFGGILIIIGWAVMQFFGAMIFMDADGLVLQEHEVVTPAYSAQITEVLIRPGEEVLRGQHIATVVSTQMLDLISELSTKKAQAVSRKEQIASRLEAISSTMPVAESHAKESTDALAMIDRAKAQGYVTSVRQDAASQARYTAVRELTTLRSEASSLQSERASVDSNIERISIALNNANQTYNNGIISSPVAGTVGPKVASAGTVMTPGDNVTEIFHGEKYVIGYLPSSRLYSISSGEPVVITDGVNRQVGSIVRVEAITDSVPPEFRSGFTSIDRQQMVRVALDGAVFPLKAKIKVTDPHAPSNLFAQARLGLKDGLKKLVSVGAEASIAAFNRVTGD